MPRAGATRPYRSPLVPIPQLARRGPAGARRLQDLPRPDVRDHIYRDSASSWQLAVAFSFLYNLLAYRSLATIFTAGPAARGLPRDRRDLRASATRGRARRAAPDHRARYVARPKRLSCRRGARRPSGGRDHTASRPLQRPPGDDESEGDPARARRRGGRGGPQLLRGGLRDRPCGRDAGRDGPSRRGAVPRHERRARPRDGAHRALGA